MLIDSFAWIELFRGSKVGRDVERILADTPVTYTAPIVLAEVYSRVARRLGEDSATLALDRILAHCAVIDADEEIALLAGRIHAELKPARKGFGMADAFVLASARRRGTKVLTGDPHFEGLEDALLLGSQKP